MFGIPDGLASQATSSLAAAERFFAAAAEMIPKLEATIERVEAKIDEHLRQSK